MNILFVFVLRILFVSAESGELPCIICAYSGTVYNSTYTFSVTDVPERCKGVLYGGYIINTASMADSDKNAITSLVSAGKIVFMDVTFPLMEKATWDVILCSDLESNKEVESLITFIKTNKINGVMLDRLGVFTGKTPDLANKLNPFLCKLKKDVPSLLVGIYVNGFDAVEFGNKELFDLSVINNNMDLLVVDFGSNGMDCDQNTAKTGKYILTGTSNDTITLEQVINGMKNAPIDQSKLVMNFMVSGVKGEGEAAELKPYTEYCCRSDNALWCIETSQMYYDQVVQAKSSIKGMMCGHLDNDDYEGTCGCGKFTVTNTFIDAWEGKAITPCAKLDMP